MAASNQQQDDYNLTYKDVSQMLGRSKRMIQEYVGAGDLNPKSIQGPRGMQKYFSESEVNAFIDQLKIESSPKYKRSGQTSNNQSNAPAEASGVVMIRELQKENIGLAREIGELKAKNEANLERVERMEKREVSYKQRIAELEPKVEQLTQDLHKKEIGEFEAENDSLQKRSNSARRAAIVGVASTFILLAFLAAIVIRTALNTV